MLENMNIGVSGGTPGADANTYVLFSSVVAFGARVMPTLGISRIQFTVKNSQAGTLKAFLSNDGENAWQEYDAQAVAIAGAGVVSGPFDYLVDSFKDFRLDWINGGLAQATWQPMIIAICGDRAVGR